jgi:ribonuclease-3
VGDIVKEGLETGEVLSTRDPKSLLQERVQARGLPSPVYRAIETTGPPHDPRFVVEVIVAGEAVARGEGRSKRQAERDAASHALEKSS